MPITIGAEIRRLDDYDFAALVREAMRQVFAVHNELGRFFDEKIYEREIAWRMAGARMEVPIDVTFESFRKTYLINLLIGGSAIFELKAVEALSERHRSQLMNYLFLTDMPHGKLVNFRPERVSHEFINNVLTREDRLAFKVADAGWLDRGDFHLKDRMVAALRDWGAALDLGLYEEAATYFCDRDANPLCEVAIRVGDRDVGLQKVRLADASTALKITCLDGDSLWNFEQHACRFLAHASLEAIQWINISRAQVQFKSLMRTG